jgi:hypothetical protein
MDSSPDHASARFREQIPQYVSGIMSPSERLDFEAWLIEHPEFEAEIEAERQLRKGFMAAHRSGLLGAQPPRAQWRQWVPAVSAAATVAFVAFAVLLNDRESDRTATAEAVAALAEHSHSPHGMQIVSLARTRGASSTPDFRAAVAELPDHLLLQPRVVVLTCADGSIDFECANGTAPTLPQYAEYDLEVVNRTSGAVAYRSLPVASAADTPLSFVLHPRAFEVGDYDLLVRGRSSTHEEIVGRFWLQISANR